MINRRIVLASRPDGVPDPENFRIEEASGRGAGRGQVLLENRVFAIDPAVRGMLDDVESYVPPVPIGGLIPTMVLGRVVKCAIPIFARAIMAAASSAGRNTRSTTPAALVSRMCGWRMICLRHGLYGRGRLVWDHRYVGLKRYGEMR